MKHANNINLLRLLAALQVVASHSIKHLDLLEASEIVAITIRMFPGVPIFFLLSGYLVYKSWISEPDLLAYIKKRAYRIFPGVWASFLFSLILLAALSQLDGGLVHTSLWVLAQVTFLQFYNPLFLRDFGVGVVNGALWTIPIELQFYAILPAIHYLLKIKHFVVGIFVMSIFVNVLYLYFFAPTTIYKLIGITIFPYFIFFLIGIYFAKQPILIKIARNYNPLVFLIVYIVSYWIAANYFGYQQSGRLLNPITVLPLAFFIFSVSFYKKLNIVWIDNNDISFGVYLYHMIFINLAIYLSLTDYLALSFSTILTLIAAYISWRFVEKPSLRHVRNQLQKS